MSKTTLRAIMQPVHKSYTVDAEGMHAGAYLGKLLKHRAGGADTLIITRFTDQEYVRGLADGGMLYARQLSDMLSVCEEVVVTFKREEVA